MESELNEFQAKQKAFAAKKPAGDKNKAVATQEELDSRGIVDIFAFEDVRDVGDGTPLFENFTFEDWALTQLRAELYLLLRGFQVDCDDNERAIHEDHLAFYYNRYFRKQLAHAPFGVPSLKEVLRMVKNTVTVDADTHAVSSAVNELDSPDFFVKLSEECRRERHRRIDAGDETARIKFTPAAMQGGGGGGAAIHKRR